MRWLFFVIRETKFPLMRLIWANNYKIASIPLHGGVGIRKLGAQAKKRGFCLRRRAFENVQVSYSA